VTAFLSRFSNRRFFLFGILLLALILRLVAISARPLWYDEAFAVLFAQEGLPAMIDGTLSSVQGSAADVHPLAYYTFLSFWISVFGQSPLAVRSFSVLLGMGILVVAYVGVKEHFGDEFGLVALLLLALSPFQIHYAQEARMYALMTLSLIGAAYALWRGMTTRRWGWLVFGLCSALAQYTHNLAAFFLIPLALIPLLKRDWRSLFAVSISGLGAVLLYLPWLLHLPAQFDKVRTAYWVQTPTPARFLTTLLSFVTNLPLPDLWLPLGLFVTLTVTILGAWQTIRAWRAGREGVHSALWLAYLAFIPPLFLYLFSLWQPVYIERALLPSGVFFLLWLAWSLTRTKLPKGIRWFAIGLLLTGMGMGIVQHITYGGFPYGPYRALNRYLAQELSPDDRIIHSNKLTMLPMVYYDRDLPQRYVADPHGSGSDTLALPTQRVLGLVADPGLQSAVGDAKRVWFVIFSQAIEEYTVEGYKSHPHLVWLEENFALDWIETWVDIQLYVYISNSPE
jgi:4-amino-4-deoxy-L-arabinose transferase-like glycosyltransferase